MTETSTPKTVAVLGAGMRGELFGEILAGLPHLARIVAVAEPRAAYRERFAARHGLPESGVYESWQEFAAQARRCDAVVIATMDRDHLGPAIACLERGYDLLLEKPMAVTIDECAAIARAQAGCGALVAVCHSLRYQKGFRTLKRLIDEGRIGRVVTIDQLEQVGFEHYAHSYVRGNWGNAGRATPMLLAKSCHDLDYIAWLVGAPCKRVSSSGSLSYFHAANAPLGAPERCTDGCPHELDCAYSAIKQYVQADRTVWPASVIAPDHSADAHLEALRTGPYGRCVFRADNDVVDHQVVQLEFERGVTATFTMTAFTAEQGRMVRVHGTRGELLFDEQRMTITLRDFGAKLVDTIAVAPEPGAHGGGDNRVLRNWLEALHRRDAGLILTDVGTSLATHAIGFAAEEARLTGQTVDLAEFRRRHGLDTVLDPLPRAEVG